MAECEAAPALGASGDISTDIGPPRMFLFWWYKKAPFRKTSDIENCGTAPCLFF